MRKIKKGEIEKGGNKKGGKGGKKRKRGQEKEEKNSRINVSGQRYPMPH